MDKSVDVKVSNPLHGSSDSLFIGGWIVKLSEFYHDLNGTKELSLFKQISHLE